jgi:hypothetical protein
MWRLELPDGRSLLLRTLPATLGRDDAASVRLRHASIAPLHARLRSTPDGRLVVEAVGEAVLQAGGHAVRVVTLDDGDTLVLGAFSFTARRDGAAPAPAEPELALRGGRAPDPGLPSAGPTVAGAAFGAGPEPQLQRRSRGPLASRKLPVKQGLLHADLSQISGGQRALLLLGLLVLAGGLAAGIAVLFSAFR